jgi:endonuclease YncB( thermonuclease family)
MAPLNPIGAGAAHDRAQAASSAGGCVSRCPRLSTPLHRKMLSTIMARGYRVLCLVLAAPLGDAATLTGRVVGVADDDTVTVLEPPGTWHAIRLAAIDA